MNRYFITLLIVLLSALTTLAQGLFESVADSGNNTQVQKVTLNGYVRGAVYGGSKKMDYASAFGEFALKSRFVLGNAFFSGDMRLREGVFFGERKTIFELKEAYVGYQAKSIDIYLGNQIVTWGRTDGFNPTNNLNASDYFFLTPDPDDQKLANFMLRTKIRFSPVTELEITGIPVFRPSVYRYSLFDMGYGVRFNETTQHKNSFENGTLAARINFELLQAGFSFSWFHGYDPFYGFNTLSVVLQPYPDIVNQAAYYKKDAWGADFAIPVKSLILRGEMAFNLIKRVSGNPVATMHIPNSDFSFVLGVERNFGELTAIAQYIGKQTFNFKPLQLPISASSNLDEAMLTATKLVYYQMQLFNRKIFHQQEKSNHGLMLALSRPFAYNAVQAEFACYYDLTSEEWFVRPGLKWTLADNLTATVGAYSMNGPDESVFSYAAKLMNGAYFGMTYNF